MKNRKTLVAVLGILGILIATVGVTYAFFSYSRTGTKENKISSGNITFLYTESSQGITISEAMPMTDVEGKALTGSNNVFDFRVTSSVGSEMRIPYTVTVLPNTANIPAQYVKLYLTDQSNNLIEDVRTLSSLDSYNNTVTGLTGEKVLYEGEVPAGTNNYNKLFRLRMWIDNDLDMSPVETTHYLCNNVEVTQEQYDLCNEEEKSINITQSYPYNNQTISVKVNVYSKGEGTTQSEAQMRANTNIETLTVGSNNVTQVDDTHYESRVEVPEGTTETTIPIVVDTENDNATVTVEEVDSLGVVIKGAGVKPVAVTKNITVGIGTHYFKITVKPEDRSTPQVYYLTVTVSDQPAVPTPVSFATDSWETIQANVQAGNLTQYNQDMANGVTREVTLTGDAVTHYLRIVNTSACSEYPTLTSETACGFVVEFADIIDNQQMNTTDTNIGGYPGTNVMYDYVTNTVYNKLPAELKAVMQSTTVVSSHGNGSDATCTASDTRDSNCNYVTTNEKIYLLDRQEVFGDNSQYNTAAGKTRQLDYYIGKQNSDRIKVKRSSDSDTNGTIGYWWLRSANSFDGNPFDSVSNNGSRFSNYANISIGVSPAFRIG